MSDQPQMKRQAGKLIIGLTGNIATGKSAVRRMAASHGALTIDADKIVHDLMDNNEEVQAAIAVAFGSRLRKEDGRIDRAALSRIVFADASALKDLEGIVHPAVRQETYRRIDATDKNIIMVEAIKLLDGGLAEQCHQIWVTRCAPDKQLQRLMVCRGLAQDVAQERIDAQEPQEEKVAMADVVIETDGLMTQTEKQVNAFWSRLPDPSTVEAKTIPVVAAGSASTGKKEGGVKIDGEAESRLAKLSSAKSKLERARKKAIKETKKAASDAGAEEKAVEHKTAVGPTVSLDNLNTKPADIDLSTVEVRRARPSDIPSILLLIAKATDGAVRMKRSDMLMALGERSYFIGQTGAQISAVIGWNIDNQVSSIDTTYLHPMDAGMATAQAVLQAIQESAEQHIGELLVVYLQDSAPPELRYIFEQFGFHAMPFDDLAGSWKLAIRESQPEGTYYLVKVLEERTA